MLAAKRVPKLVGFVKIAATARRLPTGPTKRKAFRPTASESRPPSWLKKRERIPTRPRRLERVEVIASMSPPWIFRKRAASDWTVMACWQTLSKADTLRRCTVRQRSLFASSGASFETTVVILLGWERNLTRRKERLGVWWRSRIRPPRLLAGAGTSSWLG